MSFRCSICEYETAIKCNYAIHLNSKKHSVRADIEKKKNEKEMEEYAKKIQEKKMINNAIENDFCNLDKLKENQSLSELTQKPKKSTLECECGSIFTTRQAAYKHRKYACVNVKKANNAKKQINNPVLDKDTNEIKQINNPDVPPEELYKIIHEELRKLEELRKEVRNELHPKYSRQNIINNNAPITVNQVNQTVFTLVQNNYPNAPLLKGLTKYSELSSLAEDGMTVMKTLAYKQQNNCLSKYLGDFMIKIYKKQNPEDQSVWSLDTSRLKYTVNVPILNTTKHDWIPDKEGIRFMEIAVAPVLNMIKCEAKQTILGLSIIDTSTDNDTVFDTLEIAMNTINQLKAIVKYIDSGELAKDIVKYTAPYLSYCAIEHCPIENRFVD
jgi:hypothetical protein